LGGGGGGPPHARWERPFYPHGLRKKKKKKKEKEGTFTSVLTKKEGRKAAGSVCLIDQKCHSAEAFVVMMMVAALLSSGEGIGRHVFCFVDCFCFFCGAQEVQWAVSVHTRTQGEGMVGKGGRARDRRAREEAVMSPLFMVLTTAEMG